MPVPEIKKEADLHHKSDEYGESKWEEAKKKAEEEYGKEQNEEYWAEVKRIFQRLMGDKGKL